MTGVQLTIIIVASIAYSVIGSYVFIKMWKRQAKAYAKACLKAAKSSGIPVTREFKERLKGEMTTGEYVDTSTAIFAAYAWPIAVTIDHVFQVRRRHADRKIASYQRKYDLLEDDE